MATSPSTPESSSTSSHRSLPLAITSIHQFTTPITLKLDEDNYLLWKHQVLASIRGLKLSHFLDGTNVPSTTASSAADSSSPSDDSLRYQQQDQLIIAWLLASMSTPILTNVVGLDTTADIWRCLETQFSSHTRAKVQKLKLQLKTPKNDRSISSYLHDIKNAVNMLAAIGAPISIADHIDIILEGLPEEYNAFITAVTSRTDPYTITEIEALLFAQEDRFTRYKTSHSSFLQANTASIVSPNHSKFRPTFPNSFGGGRGPPSTYNSNRFHRGKPRPSQYTSWNSNPSSWKRNPVRCQICSKLGHTAINCWHWSDRSTPPSFSANTSSFSTPQHDEPSSSLLGSPSSLDDPLWYPDSGASHHITNDHTLFTNQQPYQGHANVKLGNGAGMKIAHIGSASCISSTSSFSLHDLLHVPNITKNLLSVSKFARDNNVFFEFHPHSCYVKH